VGVLCTASLIELGVAAGLNREGVLADYYLADANEFEDWSGAH